MANLDKSIDMIEQLLVEVSDDQFDEIIKDVKEMKIEGPTYDEYLRDVDEYWIEVNEYLEDEDYNYDQFDDTPNRILKTKKKI